ncbi:alpha/beta fold hydrolase, partial [bacterium]|nr:alpha/beta fold hydrolase [bacterium]
MEEFQIQNGDITLAGARWPGDGPAMVCLHGLAANVRQWDRLAENLAGRVDLIAFDLRGRGFSSKPKDGYGPDAHLSDTL